MAGKKDMQKDPFDDHGELRKKSNPHLFVVPSGTTENNYLVFGCLFDIWQNRLSSSATDVCEKYGLAG